MTQLRRGHSLPGAMSVDSGAGVAACRLGLLRDWRLLSVDATYLVQDVANDQW